MTENNNTTNNEHPNALAHLKEAMHLVEAAVEGRHDVCGDIRRDAVFVILVCVATSAYLLNANFPATKLYILQSFGLSMEAIKMMLWAIKIIVILLSLVAMVYSVSVYKLMGSLRRASDLDAHKEGDYGKFIERRLEEFKGMFEETGAILAKKAKRFRAAHAYLLAGLAFFMLLVVTELSFAYYYGKLF